MAAELKLPAAEARRLGAGGTVYEMHGAHRDLARARA